MKARTVGLGLGMALALATTAIPVASGAPSLQSRASIEAMPYKPDPVITAIPVQPDPAEVPKPNPGGEYNAYDLNVYETIWFPERQPGDETKDDAPGGAIQHGTCPEAGCDNHALEFVKFWKKTMRPLVKPFGGTVHAYKFNSPGSGTPDGAPLNSPPGDTHNLQAIIPGATHPEEMVVVSGHYDQTDSGPASAWDSAEGHATVFRIAKIMIDHWKATGTRPAASVKFSAWSAEEAGSYGSEAFIRDNLMPFPNSKVRGYFNLDPCGGGYPAYYRGNPTDRVPLVMQLTDPADAVSPIVKANIEDFNKRAHEVVGEVFNHLDDNLTDVPTEPEIFVSDEEAEKAGVASQETEIVTALGGLFAFSSDYANFEEIGVPILNLFADVLGPHDDTSYTGYRGDGIAILHTPQDNLKTLNALTGVDQTGLIPSQGWYKGLEMCAHLHGWFMLDESMGGAIPITTKPAAYFEVRGGTAPFESPKTLRFNARGSHFFANNRGDLGPTKKIRYRWDFGDGTKGRGLIVKHTYKKDGNYNAVLTVLAPTGKDTMKLLIHIGA